MDEGRSTHRQSAHREPAEEHSNAHFQAPPGQQPPLSLQSHKLDYLVQMVTELKQSNATLARMFACF